LNLTTMSSFWNQTHPAEGKPTPTPSANEQEATHSAIAHALHDLTHAPDPAQQQAALAWLWVCCPDIAEELRLPAPNGSP
jgi:hypothetical protein